MHCRQPGVWLGDVRRRKELGRKRRRCRDGRKHAVHTDWRAHSIFDGCVAVGVGNVHRTVYTCIGLGLFVRVGKRRRETFRIFAVAVIF